MFCRRQVVARRAQRREPVNHCKSGKNFSSPEKFPTLHNTVWLRSFPGNWLAPVFSSRSKPFAKFVCVWECGHFVGSILEAERNQRLPLLCRTQAQSRPICLHKYSSLASLQKEGRTYTEVASLCVFLVVPQLKGKPKKPTRLPHA